MSTKAGPYGALSFGEFSIENILHICQFPKKDGASELKTSTSGVVIFSAEQGANVLVVSLILCVEADKPYHYDLCALLGPTTFMSL
ncbi:hypothetical protein CU097_005570 [Rhizopus azygosporus]|uniref:Uncharacterized protein n=1 Tax=Rhizopus azygosporus TaxID=86630 RepID=A0A367IVK8_RHIAZ|nr:hypothetical protein CU097_005570 [Rhizopus azygosporus]